MSKRQPENIVFVAMAEAHEKCQILRPKSGRYEVHGNTIEYEEGDDSGYDLDSGDYVPAEIIGMIGEFKGVI